MTLYLYNNDAAWPVQYPSHDEGYTRAVHDMRRHGGFIRDTRQDITDANELVSQIMDVLNARTKLEHDDPTVYMHLDHVWNGIDREDWPQANTQLLAARHHLNILQAKLAG